jgi:hypothetical protein
MDQSLVVRRWSLAGKPSSFIGRWSSAIEVFLILNVWGMNTVICCDNEGPWTRKFRGAPLLMSPWQRPTRVFCQ